MLNFKEIELSDKNWCDELLSAGDYMATEYCFTTLFIWSGIYNTTIARHKDLLAIKSCDGQTASYIFPSGKGSDEDYREVIEGYMEDAEKNGLDAELVSIIPQTAEILERIYPGKYSLTEQRNSFDYIYETERMISLAGKKYQPKRNKVSKFKSLYNWTYEKINADNIGECIEMNREWCIINGCAENRSMADETCTAKKALLNFRELGLTGGLLRIDGKVIAYTIGERINSNTFIVHVEKAFSDFTGAYQMINREFLAHEAAGLQYVNREDDAGEEGLRTAKLSYNPAFLLEKYKVKLK